jgi:hypothetical protein
LVASAARTKPAASNRLAAKGIKRFAQLRRLGPTGLVRTVFVALLGPAASRVSEPVHELQRQRLRKRVLSNSLEARTNRLKARLANALPTGSAPLLRDIDPALDKKIAGKRVPGGSIVLGEFDQDGGILPADAPIATLPCVTADKFLARSNYQIRLVDVDGRLGVRKEFGAERGRFVQELEGLVDLAAAGCSVPSVLKVDWDAHAITLGYVPGTVLREKLALAGAGVRDRDVRGTPNGPFPARIRSARAVLPKVLTPEQIQSIADEMLAIHRAGYVLDDVKYGNVILREDGRPVWVDLERALPLKGLSRNMSMYLRDVDRRKFNDHFGTELVTGAKLRSLKELPGADSADPGEFGWAKGVYAPVIVRHDIRWGTIWNTDIGVGRWNYIMDKHLPVPPGGSVLDLGANNGFNALQMLRSGAASAVGIEIDPRAIRQGEFLKEAYEWADNRSYDFKYIQGSHAELPKYDLPRFDMVSALCTLYYVSAEEMRETVRYIRNITDVLVLQANVDRLIGRSDEETYRKASVEFAVELLEDAGFHKREIIAPPGYSRPLIIGRA